MDSPLYQLAEDLKIDGRCTSIAKSAIDDFFHLLCKNSEHEYTHWRLIGSVAKQTGISTDFDFDFLIYVNSKWSEHSYVDNFRNILQEWTDVFNDFYDSRDVTVSKPHGFFLRITLFGIRMDLIIAINSEIGHVVKPVVQARSIVEHIEQSADVNKVSRYLGPSVAEAAVEFVRKQNSFVKQVIRLAKFWHQTIVDYPRNIFVPGRALIVEYIALYAAEEELRNGKYATLENAMGQFWTLLAKYRELNIIFHNNVYKHGQIPQQFLKGSPVLMDPVNPCNNLLYNESSFLRRNILGFLNSLSKSARCCLQGNELVFNDMLDAFYQ